MQECSDGAQRIRRIVQDLLAFSHSSQGKISCVDINELIDRTVRILWNEIKYRADIVKDYKATSHIWVDSNQISQVFLNVIINATSAIKKNTAADKGVITISTSEDDSFIVITISDTGCGIPKQVVGKIFDAFYTTFGGTGLGLYVSRNILNNHGGTIEAANGAKGGAVFTIRLPKVRQNQAKE